MASEADPRPLPPLFLGNPYLNPHLRSHQDELLDAVRKGGGGGGGGGGGANEAELQQLKEENARQHADIKTRFEEKIASLEAELAERRENFQAYREAVAAENARKANDKNLASNRNDAEHAKLQEEIGALTERLDQWVATGSAKLKGEAAKLFEEYENDRDARDNVEEKAEAEAAAALAAEREAQRADIGELKEQLNALNQKLENRLREPEELVNLVKELKKQLEADEDNAYAAYEEFRLADEKLAEVDGDLLNKLLASRREDVTDDEEQAAKLKQEIRDEFEKGDTVLQDQVNSLSQLAIAKKTQSASAGGQSRRI